jgi:type I restriction enzyme, S subunit
MNWPAVKMSELFRVKHGYAFKGQYFESDGPYVLLTPGSFNEEGGYRDQGDKEKFYTGDVPDGYVLDEGDLLVAMTEQAPGLLGSSAWIPEAARFLHNQRLGRIVDLDEHRLDKRFLFYLFNTREVRQRISASATGGKVRHTAPERIGQVVVRLPPRKVQRRIAEILSAYDDLIENNRRRMALLEEAAGQLYREWFVRLRFPGHEHTRITNGVPEGWERKTLADVAEVNRQSLGSRYDGDIEYVDIASVTPGQIDETTVYAFRDAPSRARRVVQHGDVIWSCVRPNRRSHAVIWQPSPNLIVSTGFAVITPKTLPTTFVYQATTTDVFVGLLENQARGAAYPAVVAGDFERAAILVPAKLLVDAFNDFAEPLLDQTNNLYAQNQKLRAARDLLLPRLMSGEIAV